MIGLAQMATVHAYAVARGYQTYPKATWRDFAVSLFVSIPALVTPGIIIGGKLFGWFTATESGCIAVHLRRHSSPCWSIARWISPG